MAGYVFRTFEERKKIEDLWEAGTPAKDIAIPPEHKIEVRRGLLTFPASLVNQQTHQNSLFFVDFWVI